MINRPRTAFVSLLLLLLASQSPAADLRGACEFRFAAASTLHDFSGTGRCLPFSSALERSPDGGVALPLVAVEVPVDGMETGIDARDRQMRGMFQADRHPRIRAEAKGVDASSLLKRMRESPGATFPVEIALAIRGVERKVPAAVGGLGEDGNRLSFVIEFPVSLSEFGLEAPSVLGIVRVGDRVLVRGAFVLEVPEGWR